MISKLRRRRKNRLALIAASLVLTPAAAAGASVDSQITAGIVLPDRTIDGMADDTGDRTPDRSLANIVTLKSGLDALSQGRAAVARKIRDSFPRTSLEHRILVWAIAMRGGYDVPSADIAAASAMLKNWPGAKTLRRNSERAIFREKPEPKEAIAAFKGSTPETLEGVLLLARAHAALGEVRETRAALSPFWRDREAGAAGRTAHHQGIRRHHSGRRPPRPDGADALRGTHQLGRAGSQAGGSRRTGQGLDRRHPRRRRRASAAQGRSGRAARGGLRFRRGEAVAAQQEVFRSRRSHAEGADRSGLRDRCGRMVAGAARVVA